MVIGAERIDAMPVVPDRKDFDERSGSVLERIIFNHRLLIIIVCAIVTALLGLQVTKLAINASFDKMMPHGHPYIKNYLNNQKDLRGLGNAVRIVVENTQGDIFDPEYLEALRDINDTVFTIPGADRSGMKSLWTPGVRWSEVTEEGFRGGPVMAEDYDGSPKSIENIKENIRRAGIVGSLVADNFKSSMIIVPLLDKATDTGEALDYGAFSRALEQSVRQKYEFSHLVERNVIAKHTGKIKVHVVGFAKLIGDLIDGLIRVMTYFALAAGIATVVLYLYTRCVRSTALVVACSVVAVVWQLGVLSYLHFDLDPYSVLVPFLVFAIGVSHGAQKMNGIMQDVGRGTDTYVAARYTFRRLFLAGLTALLADAVGFGVLMVIDIPVIRDLAVTASIGVALLVLTNLVLLPVLLSYIGVSTAAARRSLRDEDAEHTGRGIGLAWRFLNRFTERRWATGALLCAAVLAGGGFMISQHLKIGDLDAGAPELRPGSRYNRDNAFITANYGLSSDQFAVIVKTPQDGCSKYKTLIEIDRLAMQLQQVPGVQTTISLADGLAQLSAGGYEGNPKWLSINRDPKVLDTTLNNLVANQSDLATPDCSVTPLIAYLSDHRAETLDNVLAVVERFAKEHNDADVQFLPAAGSAGIEAVTNVVVRHANRTMLIYVYSAVILLCFVTFRSWRAVVVAIVPLVLTSILCEALMVMLGIGVKVATLPVIALGVGIGVDYALYLLSIQLANQRAGQPLRQAYQGALAFTGKVVALVGVTLAAGVVTWVGSPIKFQADMGILLTFMFVWNMLGALVLIPALSHFLLDRHMPASKTGLEPPSPSLRSASDGQQSAHSMAR